MSTAETVAKQAGNGGQVFVYKDRTLANRCMTRRGVRREFSNNDTRYEFMDGSAIVVCDNAAWDVEGQTKWSWAGAEQQGSKV